MSKTAQYSIAAIIVVYCNISLFDLYFRAVSKISEFTAMVKDDKENSGPSDKKLKMNSNLVRPDL